MGYSSTTGSASFCQYLVTPFEDIEPESNVSTKIGRHGCFDLFKVVRDSLLK